MTDISTLRHFVRLLVLESAPSRVALRAKELSADSTGAETSHLNQSPAQAENDEDVKMAQHLEWGEQIDPEFADEDRFGPVPPIGADPRSLPDPFVRGQFDNVTWER